MATNVMLLNVGFGEPEQVVSPDAISAWSQEAQLWTNSVSYFFNDDISSSQIFEKKISLASRRQEANMRSIRVYYLEKKIKTMLFLKCFN